MFPSADGRSLQTPCDILIRHGHVFTLDPSRSVYPDGAVAISNNSIAAVGNDADVAAQFNPSRVLDAQGAPVHPGLIDPHIHTSPHLSRTALSDDPSASTYQFFANWFNELEDEDEYASGLVVCSEMVRNGFTAGLEPGTVFTPDAMASAADAIGVRFSLADPFVWDTTAGGHFLVENIHRAPPNLARARAVLGRQLSRNQEKSGRLHGHIAIYGSGSASEELEVEAKRVADANNVILSQHQNFNVQQVERDDARFGKLSLIRLAELGVLGANCSFTHMNIIRPEELEAVVESGMSIVSQPGNYQYYGIAKTQRNRTVELLNRGVNVALCVDTAKSWTWGDVARNAYLVARQDGEYLPCNKLLEMQTIGAAQAMGLAHLIGSLEVGKRADIVVRKHDLAEASALLQSAMQMMLLSRSCSIGTVICNGDIIFSDGALTRFDESVVRECARASVKRMLGRVNARAH